VVVAACEHEMLAELLLDAERTEQLEGIDERRVERLERHGRGIAAGRAEDLGLARDEIAEPHADAACIAPPAVEHLDDRRVALRLGYRRSVVVQLAGPARLHQALALEFGPRHVLGVGPDLEGLVDAVAAPDPHDVGERLGEIDLVAGLGVLVTQGRLQGALQAHLAEAWRYRVRRAERELLGNGLPVDPDRGRDVLPRDIDERPTLLEGAVGVPGVVGAVRVAGAGGADLREHDAAVHAEGQVRIGNRHRHGGSVVERDDLPADVEPALRPVGRAGRLRLVDVVVAVPGGEAAERDVARDADVDDLGPEVARGADERQRQYIAELRLSGVRPYLGVVGHRSRPARRHVRRERAGRPVVAGEAVDERGIERDLGPLGPRDRRRIEVDRERVGADRVAVICAKPRAEETRGLRAPGRQRDTEPRDRSEQRRGALVGRWSTGLIGCCPAHGSR
jgi:hypothetical protein